MQKFVATAVLLFGGAVLSQASLISLPSLAPGSSVANVDDTVDHSGINPIGSLFSDSGIQSYSFVGSGITTSGTLREVVYQEASGTLDFFIHVSVTGGSLSQVSLVNTGDFSGFDTRVGTISPIALLGLGAGTKLPITAFRTAGGDTVTWLFASPITAGQQAATLVISSNATLDKPSNIGLIGAGGGTVTLNGFQPVAGVPEPSTLLLMGAGLLGAAIAAKKRALK